MTSWMLSCAKCRVLFVHTRIADKFLLDYLLPEKPEFPPGGTVLECPNCGHSAIYQRTDLTYKG